MSALYHAAGLSLGHDLATLTRGANIRADAPAVRWMERNSDPTGPLQVHRNFTPAELVAGVQAVQAQLQTGGS